ncbi:hypothetical protein CAC42_5709 [Sphaceloma murrayae]|uniref:Uncharacterized protein n=1 Tax=Sphaceloma murrayae TaxID=2082308 RepID=A0A2K1QZ10_9PEZI|nr:hypothetical protein CAC42_5709 [Sphaceloma murrayae]
MFSPQPVSKKPPGVLSYAHTPSRDHSQRSIPSFQSFIKRTPPPLEGQKPLPPDPPSRHDESRERRRSSSVYSRHVNHWAATPESWARGDIGTGDFGCLSAQDSHHKMDSKLSDQHVLQPTVYLPDPAKAKGAYDSGVQFSAHSAKHSYAPSSSPPRDYVDSVRTISLLEAQRQVSSKHAPALLPEELRARVRSNASMHSSTGNSSIHKLSIDIDDDDDAPRTAGAVHFDMHDASHAKPQLLGSSQSSSSDPYQKYAEAYRQDADASPISFEARGRTTDRGIPPRSPGVRYGPPSDDLSPRKSSPSEAERLAWMYHAVLRDESLRSSRSRHSSRSASSSSDIRAHMKMIPQPLFHNPRQISEQRTREYSAPRFIDTSTVTKHRPGILKNASEPLPYHRRPGLGPMSSRRVHTGLTDPHSPASDKSDTPIIGRFASPIATKISTDHRTRGQGTFTAMKDMLSNVTVGTRPFRRVSLHVPAAIKDSVKPEEMKKKFETLATKSGQMLEMGEKRREREREERVRELKSIIRVVPNT